MAEAEVEAAVEVEVVGAALCMCIARAMACTARRVTAVRGMRSCNIQRNTSNCSHTTPHHTTPTQHHMKKAHNRWCEHNANRKASKERGGRGKGEGVCTDRRREVVGA